MYKIKIEVYNEFCEECPHLEIYKNIDKYYSKCNNPEGCIEKEKMYQRMIKYMEELKKEIYKKEKEDTPWQKN